MGLAWRQGSAEQGANVFLVATNEVLLKEATSAIQERSAVQAFFTLADLRTLEGCNKQVMRSIKSLASRHLG